MAKPKSTRSVKVDTPQGPVIVADHGRGAANASSEAFDRIYDGMQDELCALECAIAAIECADWEKSDELCSALSLLRRTYRTLDKLHDDLERFAPKVRS